MQATDTILTFLRQESSGVTAVGTLTLRTSVGEADAKLALTAAISAWVKSTKQGLQLWRSTSADLNIGDLANAGAFDDQALQTALSERGLEVISCHIGNAESCIPFDRVLVDAAAVEKQFTVVITSETWDEASRAIGETDAKEVLVQDEIVSNEDLQGLAKKYGTTDHVEGSGTSISLRSSYPSEDRAHFERGEDTYYLLHVTEVNGAPPTSQDRPLVYLLAGANLPEEESLEHDVQQLAAQCQRRGLPHDFFHEHLMEAAWRNATTINHEGAVRQLEFLAALPPELKVMAPGERIEVVVDRALQQIAHEASQKDMTEQLLTLANFTNITHARQLVLNYDAPTSRDHGQRG